MAEEFKKAGLMDGMGESDEIERWITVKGNHVPIKKGQTPKRAIEQAFDKPKNKLSKRDNIKNMGVFQLKKSIRSLEKQIKVHEEKIRNSDDIGLIQHWRKEIKKFANEILKYENELKKRGH